eukprot:3373510-Amphidinium_carterae.2
MKSTATNGTRASKMQVSVSKQQRLWFQTGQINMHEQQLTATACIYVNLTLRKLHQPFLFYTLVIGLRLESYKRLYESPNCTRTSWCDSLLEEDYKQKFANIEEMAAQIATAAGLLVSVPMWNYGVCMEGQSHCIVVHQTTTL